MLEDYIEKLKESVNNVFSGDAGSHDISHLIRVMNTALYIQEREGGDRLIVGISSFLHDVHRIMENECGHFVSPKDSIPKVKEILSSVDLTEEQINEICFCIENHEKYNWNGDNVDDINALILQDADNIDAIGAIGIARAFSAGGVYKLAMYDDTKPFVTENFVEGDKDPSVIHHFYHKLFNLEKQMNTKTAKEIAKKRTNFMKNFTNEFIDEWNSKIS